MKVCPIGQNVIGIFHTTRTTLSLSSTIPQVSAMKSPFLNSSPPVCPMVCMTPWHPQSIHPSQRGSKTRQSRSTPCSSACSGSPHSAQKSFHYSNSWQHLPHSPPWLLLQWAKLWASLSPQAASLWPHHTIQPPWTPGLSTEGAVWEQPNPGTPTKGCTTNTQTHSGVLLTPWRRELSSASNPCSQSPSSAVPAPLWDTTDTDRLPLGSTAKGPTKEHNCSCTHSPHEQPIF